MSFERDPATVPRLPEIARGLSLLMGLNVVLLVIVLLGTVESGDLRSLELGLALFALHGLWQWAYVLPLYRRLSRGMGLGVLLGAGLYTFSHAGFVLIGLALTSYP
jgi:hypothetical protein